MKATTVMDERGRITLGKKLGKKYGRKFYVVPAVDEIILMPVSTNDPIKGFAELGKKSGMNKYSVKQLLKMAEKEAEKEILSELHQP